jgi:hypothetical protein
MYEELIQQQRRHLESEWEDKVAAEASVARRFAVHSEEELRDAMQNAEADLKGAAEKAAVEMRGMLAAKAAEHGLEMARRGAETATASAMDRAAMVRRHKEELERTRMEVEEKSGRWLLVLQTERLAERAKVRHEQGRVQKAARDKLAWEGMADAAAERKRTKKEAAKEAAMQEKEAMLAQREAEQEILRHELMTVRRI